MRDYETLKGKRVLLVDDEPEIIETLEELLYMCKVTTATSFGEAKHLFETQEFDFAILDIMGVKGFLLLDIAKEKKVLAIMLTAHAMTTEETVKSYKKGAAFFIPKEEMYRIKTFMSDILEYSERGEHNWTTWLERLGGYYEKKFGVNWKDRNKEFWDAIASRDWKKASDLRNREDGD